MLLVGLFSLLAGFTALTAVHVDDELTQQSIQVLSTLITVLLVVAIFMLLPVAKFLFLHFPVIRHVATTLAVNDIESLERIVQSSKDDPRFGEGLAAALDFDVGGF